MNKAIAAVAVLVVVIGGFFLFKNYSSAPTVDTGGSTPVTSAPSESINPNGAATSTSNGANATFTLAQVAQHANRTSCYSAINGSVYDLTSWIDKHPGGPQRILAICGKDGSSSFDPKHGGDPRALTILAGFKIGTLAQ